MRHWKKGLVYLLTGTILLTAGGCGSSEGESGSGTSDSGEFDINSAATDEKTRTIQKLIDDRFYYDIDPTRQEEAYYDGMLNGLGDKYARYYTPEEFAKTMEEDSGEYVGIGCTVSQRAESREIYVVEPMRGSPAEEAGLLPEDVFVEIDGVALTTGMELDEVVKMIRGSANSTAHLKMYREGEDDFLEFDVPRRKVQNITVDYEMLENGMGYIKISDFIDNTSEQFKEGVDYLIGKGASAIIFDIRNNPGGFTDEATEMVDYIVPDNTVPAGGDPEKPGLLLEIRDKEDRVMFKSYTEDGHEVTLPMAILMNSNSASSSEIFIGCLRDYGKVVMVGEKSYGKGIVQQTFPLQDGSAVKMTIASYFLPAGSNIHEQGIEPDVEVKLPIEKLRILNRLPHNEDPQLIKAIEVLGGTPLPEPETTEQPGTTEQPETTEQPGTTETTEE